MHAERSQYGKSILLTNPKGEHGFNVFFGCKSSGPQDAGTCTSSGAHPALGS